MDRCFRAYCAVEDKIIDSPALDIFRAGYEAAMGGAASVYIAGSDEVLQCESYHGALRQANQINTQILETHEHGDPFTIAVVRD